MKTMSIKHKIMRVFLITVIIFSTFMTTIFSWSSSSHNAINEIYGEGKDIPVYLLKLEKDVDGNANETVIPNAEFYLYKVGEPDIQIGSTYTTNEEGKIDVTLPIGDYYFVETRPSSTYTYDVDTKGDIITHYPFTVTKEDANKAVVIAYNRKIAGDLIIEKIVKSSHDKVLSKEQLDREFTFIVTFSDNGTYSYTIDEVSYRVKSGEKLYLKHGQQAIFKDIPTGIVYTIEEEEVEGYVVSSHNHQGTIKEEGSIATFVNTYQEGKHTGSLQITKTVTGEEIDIEKVFDFIVTIDNQEYTFSLKHGETKVFENLPVGATYRVEEKESEGYIGQPKQYTGTIIDGEIVLPFINHKDDGSKETGILEIGKTVVAESIDTNKEFYFTITLEDLPEEPTLLLVGVNPTIVSATDNTIEVVLKHGERIEIENLPAGVSYKIEEKEDSEYLSTITNVEGSIVSKQRIWIGFTNQYIEGVEPEETSLLVKKEVEGEIPEIDKDLVFSFVLLIDNQEPILFTLKNGESKEFTELKAGTKYVIQEVDIKEGYALVEVENGTGTLVETPIEVVFKNTYVEEIQITKTGTKYWDTKGHNPTLPESITLHLKEGDTIVETQVVTPNDKGEWTYTFIVPKYDKEGKEIVYTIEEEEIENWVSHVQDMDITNVYITPVTIEEGISIVKRIIGDKPKENASFQFKIKGEDNAPMPEGYNPTNNSKVITITGEGEEVFQDITYTKAGTYVYTISEQHTGESGYTYDTVKYRWIVEVEEVENALVIVSKKLLQEDTECKEAVFTNKYSEKVANEKVEIKGTKTWKHGELDPKYQPTSITIIVRIGNQIIIERDIGEADQWRWSFILDKYDANGKEITYTVDELDIPGYEKKIEGYNIINTYTGNSNTGDNDNNNNTGSNNGSSGGNNSNKGNNASEALTSDGTVLNLWIVLIIISGSALLLDVVWQETLKRRKRN